MSQMYIIYRAYVLLEQRAFGYHWALCLEDCRASGKAVTFVEKNKWSRRKSCDFSKDGMVQNYVKEKEANKWRIQTCWEARESWCLSCEHHGVNKGVSGTSWKQKPESCGLAKRCCEWKWTQSHPQPPRECVDSVSSPYTELSQPKNKHTNKQNSTGETWTCSPDFLLVLLFWSEVKKKKKFCSFTTIEWRTH